MTVRHDELLVDWYGYATARIEHPGTGTVVYTDPGRYGTLDGTWEADSPGAADAHPPGRDRRPRDGDVVVVTHDHHYDSDGVRRVAAEDATVVVYEAVDAGNIDRAVEPVEELPHEVVRPHDEDDFLVEVDDAGDVVVRTVPAYNLPDGDNLDASGDPMHPEGFGCGYLLTLGESTAFWPGDSDRLPGHEELDVDLFLPPIGNFTMNRHEAAELAGALDPDLVVPIHYNTFAALESDSAAFAADVAKRGVPVALAER